MSGVWEAMQAVLAKRAARRAVEDFWPLPAETCPKCGHPGPLTLLCGMCWACSLRHLPASAPAPEGTGDGHE